MRTPSDPNPLHSFGLCKKASEKILWNTYLFQKAEGHGALQRLLQLLQVNLAGQGRR